LSDFILVGGIINHVALCCSSESLLCIANPSVLEKQLFPFILGQISNNQLIFQIICPMLLMNLPLSLMYFMFFTGLESPVFLNYFSGVAMALYPLVTPIITILFVKDYRRQCLVTLHVIDKPTASVLPVTTTFKTMSTAINSFTKHSK
uniref:G protein-coupled receptor n=1 Tax=Haemonchus placei TaxID=6290 RepID=A0A0N4WUR7_HAEPC